MTNIKITNKYGEAVIRTPVGSIAVTPDPTLKPGEVAFGGGSAAWIIDPPVFIQPPSPERPTLSARLGLLKHGPGGSGLSGPCDDDCAKCKVEAIAKAKASHLAAPIDCWGDPMPPASVPPPDPLDTEHDGFTLRELLIVDRWNRRDMGAVAGCRVLTPAQRAAVSAHWSTELRAKVAASAERDRSRVLVDPQDEP